MQEPASQQQAPAQRDGPHAISSAQLQTDFVSQQASAWQLAGGQSQLQPAACSQSNGGGMAEIEGHLQGKDHGSIS